MNKTITIFMGMTFVTLAGCGKPLDALHPTAAISAVQPSSGSNVAITAMGHPNGKTIALNLFAPMDSKFKAQAIVHRWTSTDLYQYEVTLSRDDQSLVTVPVRCINGQAKAIFTHLKPGVRYAVSVLAMGNIGGTAPDTLLNSQNPAEGEFDFRGANDIDDNQTTTIRVKFDDVLFDGTGTINLETADGNYLSPTASESGAALCIHPTPAPSDSPPPPSGTVLGTYGTNGAPYGVAFDGTGNAYVSSSHGNVLKLSANGTELASYPVGNRPYGVAVDANGNLWVANSLSNNIMKLSPSGDVLETFSVGIEPTGIAFDPAGNLWVTNASSHNIMKLSPSGDILATYPAAASYPQGIAFDSDGTFWVSNFYDTVSQHSTSGTVLNAFPISGGPSGLTFDSAGNLWVSRFYHNTVSKLSRDGAVLATYPVGHQPHQLAFNSTGNLWVTNWGSNTVTVLAP